MVAKYISPKLAGGLYHEYSGFIFFPIALASMLVFSRLLELPYFETARHAQGERRSKPAAPPDRTKGRRTRPARQDEDDYDY